MDDSGTMEYYLIFNIFGEIWPFKLYKSFESLLKRYFSLTYFLFILSTKIYCMSTVCQTLLILLLLAFIYFFRGRVWIGIAGKFFSVGQRLGIF